MFHADFVKLVPCFDYRDAIYGQKEVYLKKDKLLEHYITEKLFKAWENGTVATICSRKPHTDLKAAAEAFVVGYFETLAANLSVNPEAAKEKRKLAKEGIKILAKAEPSFNKHKEKLSLANREKIEAIVKSAILKRKAEKAAKEEQPAQKSDKKSAPKEVVPLDPVKTAHYGKFPEETLPLSALQARAVVLRANDFEEAEKLAKRIKKQTSENPQRKEAKELNKCAPKYDCTTIPHGHQEFIFSSCPKNAGHAAALFDAVLGREGSVLVSTLESHEASDKYNLFWTRGKVETLPLQSGWTLEHMESKVIATGTNPEYDDPKVIETTIKATKERVTKTVTHLHYDGWLDRNAAPDERLLMTLLLRMRELNSQTEIPFSINCHGGVGRTGTTGLCYELFRQIDKELASGKKLDDIQINIPEALYKMRMKGRDIMSQETCLAQVHAVVFAYYEHLKLKAHLLTLPYLHSVLETQKRIAEYAINEA